ncbi:MAG: hypothetical protein EZS28_056414 [Streblomastix strix]|uniref:Uncharacterized protein n=1 Tax=Streblomastix strix TaxID=222440 RepID=A0A5J4PM76_9EUKA|nr:MAG: hypothetical protein EZS28_056414 [Streblomastix strix]
MTPASDANPQSDGTVTAGTSTEYSRGDHIHPLNISPIIPQLPRLNVIGIYVYVPVIEETISFVKISVTRVGQYVPYLLTETVTIPLPFII